MLLLLLFITSALVVISLITLSNMLLFPRLKAAKPAPAPLVSVMIPARNEAAVIGQTLANLRQQDYPNYEVILLDDHSDDGTGQIARAAMQGVGNFRLIQGAPLPEGWMGKNWACHQMQQVAAGELLVFTDADVRWSPGALAALVTQMQRSDADLFTVWPTQHTYTWSERLIVPLMAVVVLGYLPVLGTHYLPLSVFGAANGQCMAWKRRAYERMGGHKAVYDNVLEDVTLARIVKGRGLRLRMADGNNLISCRMYQDWASVRDGYAKNILAGYGSAFALLLATLFHLMIFILPLLWLGFGWLLPSVAGWPQAPLLLVLMGLLVRALTAAFTGQRVLDALFMPLSVLLMTRIAAQALYWHYRYGGPRWKGRVIRRRNPHRTKRQTKTTPPERRYPPAPPGDLSESSKMTHG